MADAKGFSAVDWDRAFSQNPDLALLSAEDLLITRIACEWNLLDLQKLFESAQWRKSNTGALGPYLVERGWASVDELYRLLREQNRRQESPIDAPRYEIRERLGEGASAVVYRAWDRELNREVALKVLRETSGMSELARQRFRREAQTAAGLSHPNLVAVYDVGESKGRLYLVMELVQGPTLSEVLKDKKRARDPALRLLELAARGVAAAHKKGVVHRDLKPANIIVPADGGPKVADFGLAHLVDSSAELTRSGSTLGTPLYMSPEQVGGKSNEVRPPTDVHALGAILYEVLAGHPPHSGETLQEIYGKIVRDDPPPLRDVPRDLEMIVLKALDKEPGRRYPTAEEFADDLRRFLAGEPTLARPLPPAVRAWRAVKRRKAAAAALLLILGLGAWGITVMAVARTAAEKSRHTIETLQSFRIPTIERAEGEVFVRRGPTLEPARVGLAVAPGEAVETRGPGSQAVLKYLDSTSIELRSDAAASRPPEGPADAAGPREMVLERGFLTAEAPGRSGSAPLRIRTSHATVEATRARFLLSTEEDHTRLAVLIGAARLVRQKDGKTVDVAQGRSAVARSGSELVALTTTTRTRVLLYQWHQGGVERNEADSMLRLAARTPGLEIDHVQGALGSRRLEDYHVLWLTAMSLFDRTQADRPPTANAELLARAEEMKAFVRAGGSVWVSTQEYRDYHSRWLPYPVKLAHLGRSKEEPSSDRGRSYLGQPNKIVPHEMLQDEIWIEWEPHYEVLTTIAGKPSDATALLLPYGKGYYLLAALKVRNADLLEQASRLFENALFLFGKLPEK